MYICIHIHIYIYRERERERDQDDDDEESDADDGYVSKQSVRFCVADMAGALMRSRP